MGKSTYSDATALGIAAGSVAAVIVTHNRRLLLQQVLDAVVNQTHPVDEVIVVDNASSDGTGAMVRDHFPEVTYLPMAENLGSAGGWVAGIGLAYKTGHEWLWLLDDDILPEASTLANCLRAAGALNKCEVGIVCPEGLVNRHPTNGKLWRGKPVSPPCRGGSLPYEVDVVELWGALLNRHAVTCIGNIRADYFMDWWGAEYCLRMRAAGLKIIVLPSARVRHLPRPSNGFSPPWRGYYQTRNHLAMALEHRSPRELFWWAVRQAKLVTGTLHYPDHRWQRIRLRFIGAWHGVRGIKGRTIDPESYSPR